MAFSSENKWRHLLLSVRQNLPAWHILRLKNVHPLCVIYTFTVGEILTWSKIWGLIRHHGVPWFYGLSWSWSYDADPSDFLFRRELGERKWQISGYDAVSSYTDADDWLFNFSRVAAYLFTAASFPAGYNLCTAFFSLVTHSFPHQIIFQSSSILAGALSWSLERKDSANSQILLHKQAASGQSRLKDTA